MKREIVSEKDGIYEDDALILGSSFGDLMLLYKNENPARHPGKTKEQILKICLKKLIADRITYAKEILEENKEWFLDDGRVVDGEIKTLQGYKDSDSETFEEYFSIGCIVSEDVIDEFRNVLPPRTDSCGIMQMGEAYSYARSEVGKYKITYVTFAYINGCWKYCGHCFAGEIVNRD
ncbi:hypothetical protein [Clostridium sp.]|uniref:hypothetical protein n=1 Tax=Clostridium sp. TaxID=1506 RepID=UPI0032180EA5